MTDLLTACLNDYEARMRAKYPRLGEDLDCRRRNGGMTLRDLEDMYASVDAHNAAERRKALVALWAPPVVDERLTKQRRDGVVCYTRNRDDEWTLWRAICATIGLVLVRYAKDGMDGHAMAYWDNVPVYGGYSVEVLRLYPGCRIEHFNDGEAEHGW